MVETELCCDICGDALNSKYVHTLKCNHSYHYECIMKTFMYDKKRSNQCPLCRTKNGLLPLVNGLPKLTRGIHFYNLDNGLPHYECKPCIAILQSGKRKGLSCGSKCKLGFSICKRHHTSKLTKEKKVKEHIEQ